MPSEMKKPYTIMTARLVILEFTVEAESEAEASRIGLQMEFDGDAGIYVTAAPDVDVVDVQDYDQIWEVKPREE